MYSLREYLSRNQIGKRKNIFMVTECDLNKLNKMDIIKIPFEEALMLGSLIDKSVIES